MLIGGLNLKNPVCLAPMAGVTNVSLREFFSGLGAALTHTEMISCAGLVRDNVRTGSMLRVSKLEAPLIVQLFSPDADTLRKGAEAALKINSFAGLGINMACPMPKVTKRGAGAALLKNPAEAVLMVSSLKKFNMPVWVKIRKLESPTETLRFIEILAKAGADNVCLHGRTAAQRYDGSADRDIVEEAAKHFPGLISASGDVRTPADVREYMDIGCAAVMLARGALANPWLLPESLDELGYDVPNGHINPANMARLDALRRLGERAKDQLNEHQAVVILKRLMGGILRGMEGAAELRRRAGQAVTLDDILRVFSSAA